MKKINYLLILLSVLIMSCNDWLDIKPKDETGEKDLFSEAEGFRNAINGIYIDISETSLYGKNLTWGLLDVLAQNIYSPEMVTYQKASKYDYTYSGISDISDEIWLTTYNAIVNCNNLIANIKDKDEKLFKEKEKQMIYGEALAIRSMLHFDLLRLYAPSLKVGNEMSVPYYDKKTKEVQPRIKTGEMLDNLVNDLKKASDLLILKDTTAEIRSNMARLFQRFGTRTIDKDFSHRGYRLNYYATQTLLARVYMYMGMKKEAYDIGKKIREFEIFEFSSESDVSGNIDHRDVKMRGSIIGGLHSTNLTKNYANYTTYEYSYSHLFLKNMESLFDDEKNDYRYKYLMHKNNSDIAMYSLKYIASNDDGTERDERPLIPLFRLSEHYYNMCEYLAEEGKMKDAVDLLNELRVARGIINKLPENISLEEFMEELVKDSRKEYIGEGQGFFLLKRLNHSIKTGDKLFTPDEIGYVLPYPLVETNI